MGANFPKPGIELVADENWSRCLWYHYLHLSGNCQISPVQLQPMAKGFFAHECSLLIKAPQSALLCGRFPPLAPTFWKASLRVQGGPLHTIINGIITPKSRVVTYNLYNPQLSIYKVIYRGPITAFIRIVGVHLVQQFVPLVFKGSMWGTTPWYCFASHHQVFFSHRFSD